MQIQSPQIIVNDNTLNHQRQRGVVRVVDKVIESLSERFGSSVTIYSPQRRRLGPARQIAIPRLPANDRLKIHDRLASLLVGAQPNAVLYSAYYGIVTTRAPQVFTVYDMVYERFPDHFPRRDYFVRRFIAEKQRCFERATLLLAISQSTADDICRLYPQIDPAKIVVTLCGVDDFFLQARDQPVQMPGKPYFFFLGNRGLYKNFQQLLSAFGRSGLADDFDLRVLSPIGGRFERPEAELIARYRLERSVHLVTASSDEMVRDTYAGAAALIYPSEYEGFGLPVLEAMACGSLVATSNTSSMPEVGGDVAFYFNPHDVESITARLIQIARLPLEQRCAIIERGFARARTFTWDRFKAQTIDAFSRVVQA